MTRMMRGHVSLRRPPWACVAASVLALAMFGWAGFGLVGVFVSTLALAAGSVALRKPAPFLAVACAVLAGYFTSCAGYMFIPPSDSFRVFLGIALAACVWLLAVAATGRIRAACLVSMAALTAFGTAGCYVVVFRDPILVFQDLFSVRTAMAVAGRYDFTPCGAVLLCAAVFAFGTALVCMLCGDGPAIPVIAMRWRAASVFFVIVLGLAMRLVLFRPLAPGFWNDGGNGFLLNFVLTVSDISPDEPDGYGDITATLDRLSEQYPSDSVAGSSGLPEHIVFIMCESFAAPGLDVADPDACMPYLSDMSGVRGWAYPSVFGGSTANSEYEFLTGGSIANLPRGVVPYQTEIGTDIQSVARQMSALGYHTMALHPYMASSWNRDSVYGRMGFDEFLSGDDTDFDIDLGSRLADRGYLCSDAELYQYALDYLEPSGRPEFLFLVTLQGHGPYGNSLENELESYRACVRESDRALHGFLDGLAGLDGGCLVIFFGDHAPGFAYGSYPEVLGVDPDSLEGQARQDMCRTPYLIWSDSRGIPDDPDGRGVSVNYLCSYGLSLAGMPLTGYQKFLYSMSSDMPVVNAFVTPDADGSDGDALELYNLIQYAHDYGSDDVRNHSFFSLAP